jgi:hypothetical protein
MSYQDMPDRDAEFACDGEVRFVASAPCCRRQSNAFWVAKGGAGSQNVPMSSQAAGLRVASVIFALFAIGHLVRLFEQAQVTVGTYQIPMWISVVALIIAITLSIWMWRLSSARS